MRASVLAGGTKRWRRKDFAATGCNLAATGHLCQETRNTPKIHSILMMTTFSFQKIHSFYFTAYVSKLWSAHHGKVGKLSCGLVLSGFCF
jgi:hypothetical protein